MEPSRLRFTILGLLAAGASLLIGCGSPPVRTAPPARSSVVDLPRGDDSSDQTATTWLDRLVELHNRERRKRGLPDVEVDSKLALAARRHARDMARRQRMSHRGSDWSSPFDRMERAGYAYQSAAENVAYGQISPEQVLRDWMNSPGHRRAILGDYSQIGAAYATAPDGKIAWCVTFGEPKAG